MPNPLLQIENLASGYGDVQVLWDVSLKVESRRLITLVGANGAGKTTTLRASMGSIPPWSGRIFLAGEDVTRLPPHAKAQRGMVLVPEGRQLFASMTIEENLELGAFSDRARRMRKQNLDRVYTLFPRLRDRRRQRARTFSGGEQQMLAVARGLMAEPMILIIDELSLGLAPVLVQQLFGTLDTLKREGVTMLLVEQNVHLALALSDYAYVLADGRVALEGPAPEVKNMPEVRAAYLGL